MKIEDFFYNSAFLDIYVLKPLSHIRENWDLSWDPDVKRYIIEEDSFGKEINELITELEITPHPEDYHKNEDILAEYIVEKLNWDIVKIKNRWTNADYKGILEQGGFGDIHEKNLVLAVAGRISTAIKFGQNHFDKMEEGHSIILSNIMSIILYHRYLA